VGAKEKMSSIGQPVPELPVADVDARNSIIEAIHRKESGRGPLQMADDQGSLSQKDENTALREISDLKIHYRRGA
jgi:hypothetical protein